MGHTTTLKPTSPLTGVLDSAWDDEHPSPFAPFDDYSGTTPNVPVSREETSEGLLVAKAVAGFGLLTTIVLGLFIAIKMW